MAETNPQPVQEAAPQAAPTKGGFGLTGPIVAAIVLVAGIAGIFEFMVKGALETTSAKTSFPDALINKHGVIYHACCETDPCCGMVNCCDLKENWRGV